jgi:cation:H+ antiporter
MPVIMEMLAMLAVIVIAAEVFTNALEHLGERLKISEGVTGSLFAAVGTAMPESMVPLLALLAGTDDASVNEEIGVGAILGAPLMLSTLTLFLMSMGTIGQRGPKGALRPERTGLRRDLDFFLFAFGIAAVALFLPHRLMAVRAALAMSLIMVYFIYVMMTVRVSAKLVEDGHGTHSHTTLYLCRLGLPDRTPVLAAQIALGLALLIAGAEGFIHCVEEAAALLGMSTLLLSLLIIPVATELPEKVNSLLWIRRRKDTLAFGNITGAMVFQGTLLPAIGILLTPWEPRREVLAGVLITFAAALWLRLIMKRGAIVVWHLGVNGAFYALYLTIALL